MLKTFTPEQAQKALSFVRPTLEDALREWEAAAHKNGPSFPLLEHALTDLFSVGCIVKDLQKGHVDFPSIEDEKLIALCWNPSEEAILHKHALTQNCSERIARDQIEPHLLTQEFNH